MCVRGCELTGSLCALLGGETEVASKSLKPQKEKPRSPNMMDVLGSRESPTTS